MTDHIHKWRVLESIETDLYGVIFKRVLLTCDGCGELKTVEV